MTETGGSGSVGMAPLDPERSFVATAQPVEIGGRRALFHPNLDGPAGGVQRSPRGVVVSKFLAFAA